MYHSSAASTRCHAFTSRAVSAARRHSIFCRYAAITRLRTLPDVGSPDPPCFRFSWSTDFGSFGPIKYSKRASLPSPSLIVSVSATTVCRRRQHQFSRRHTSSRSD
ncbi:Uncharacterized protein FWK35_00002943 [Aphis craccivora]|uniref:Uncharacterized protein n=1 Tax=Aphis craccivora TaxID=307492 RepID=A0A6G0ZN14_APHCR|nr:Uncharacterized protein FWK35_00002943 [Aphis craccivora]